MPIYSYSCTCGKVFDKFCKINQRNELVGKCVNVDCECPKGDIKLLVGAPAISYRMDTTDRHYQTAPAGMKRLIEVANGERS